MRLGLMIRDNKVIVSSRDIAAAYEKQHKDVLRSIDDILVKHPELGVSSFRPTKYEDVQNKEQRSYDMDRQGFSILVNKFTGDKALDFTIRYTEAFEKMANNIQPQGPLQIDSKMMFQIAQALSDKEKQVEVLSLENKQKMQIIGELKPKADYLDSILKNKGLVTITQIAKDYGMTGQAMNDILHTLGVQYKQSHQWLLYKEHQACGYTHSETIDIIRSDGRPDVKMNTKWTQKGRLFLYDLLKLQGTLPIIETKSA